MDDVEVLVGRPPLPVGTAGKTTFVALPTGQIQARAKFRDFDGRIRLVAKHGRSRAAAERALQLALADCQMLAGGGAIAASTRVAELRLREVTTGVISRALRAIADRHGPSAAKFSKACLSGMFRMAIEDGAISANPVRDSSTRISVGKKSPRALTPEEVSTLTGWLRANERAAAFDIPIFFGIRHRA